MVNLRGGVGSLQLSCEESPNLVCKDSVTTFKGTTSGIKASCIVRGREENRMALVDSWGALCLHTTPTETCLSLKGGNFGNTSSSPSTPLWLFLSFTLSKLYGVCILCLLVSLLCHIGCPPSCISRQPILLSRLI